MPWTTAAPLSVELPPPVILKKRPEGAKSKDPARRQQELHAPPSRWPPRDGWGTAS